MTIGCSKIFFSVLFCCPEKVQSSINTSRNSPWHYADVGVARSQIPSRWPILLLLPFQCVCSHSHVLLLYDGCIWTSIPEVSTLTSWIIMQQILLSFWKIPTCTSLFHPARLLIFGNFEPKPYFALVKNEKFQPARPYSILHDYSVA